ncbi:nitrate- and nitrite sensing domain-containing protein [Streptomyces sp. SPB074]|uniref:sensor histidine kinase n=1 Tax=Streptomyces sp. (strain SPB074) TaxID=465543 RepID=UPI0001D1DC91|nr:nitrate- and nitrite sensing domain-containing protein [Streptomyces sp. SPB074]EFG65590.1 large secreted protein [Streptomyces sp. SPB074]
MRFRGKSIRRKIVALLLVPLLSLGVVWAYATVISGQEAYQVLGVSRLIDRAGQPVKEATRALQQERTRTLVYLADPRGSDVFAAMRRSYSATDEAVGKVRDAARDKGLRNRMNGTSRRELDALVDSFTDLTALRRSAEDNRLSRTSALRLYSDLVEPCFGFLTDLRSVKDVALDKRGRGVVGIDRARELLTQEDAVVSAALTGHRLGRDEIQKVSDLIAQRELLYDTNLALLPDEERKDFEAYWKKPGTSVLTDAEYGVSQSAPSAVAVVDAATWTKAATKVLADLAVRDDATESAYRDAVTPYANGVLLRTGVAGFLGLVALLLSLYLSVRIGRSLVRDLSALRRRANETAGVRLPEVMRRLAAGEEIDIETVAPRLAHERDEMGQVAQALETLQRAAVEAAVRQADMRKGVSEVFVNLARRSQVLLHKQLTLLDTMERRTEDTDELADLFRLDHLTTRMRRHAEGLVILSGAAPARQWRRPVPLMDVVRAAVSEVEDYERVEVRRLPRVAVTGTAVGDLTHLLAELMENAAVFSPPHTAVQVLGERVGQGFLLEIHDRGLGMTKEALLAANQRLAETPEFELSDTDRLGLFVVSRIARRQGVKVSLQPSPYGGTTAVVVLPEKLLTDVPGTDGAGFPAASPDGLVALEAPAGAQGRTAVREPVPAGVEEGPRGPLTQIGALPRRPVPKLVTSHGRPVGDHTRPDSTPEPPTEPGAEPPAEAGAERGHPAPAPGPLPHRRPRTGEKPATGTPGEPGTGSAPGTGSGPGAGSAPRASTERDDAAGPGTHAAPAGAPTGLPRRVRQASLARQLRERSGQSTPARPEPERDADAVRTRMASLQRGWLRGREEEVAADARPARARATEDDDGPEATGPDPHSTAQGNTPERDGR